MAALTQFCVTVAALSGFTSDGWSVSKVRCVIVTALHCGVRRAAVRDHPRHPHRHRSHAVRLAPLFRDDPERRRNVVQPLLHDDHAEHSVDGETFRDANEEVGWIAIRSLRAVSENGECITMVGYPP